MMRRASSSLKNLKERNISLHSRTPVKEPLNIERMIKKYRKDIRQFEHKKHQTFVTQEKQESRPPPVNLRPKKSRSVSTKKKQDTCPNIDIVDQRAPTDPDQ